MKKIAQRAIRAVTSKYEVTVPLIDRDIKIFLLGKPTQEGILKILSNPYLCTHISDEERKQAMSVISEIAGEKETIEGLNTKHAWKWLSHKSFPKSIIVYFMEK